MLRRSCCSSLVMLFLTAAAAAAQGDPPVGVRAAGMGGAFTAVADDATAVAWNPAGLASGSYFSLALDGNSFDRQSTLFAGIGTPPLGLAYYRIAIAGLENGRNTLVAHNFGVALVQSLGDTGVAIGTTLKVVHGVVSTAGSAIGTTKFDADIGVMASGGLGQLGLTVHNVARPSFAAAVGDVRLDRAVRGGISVHVRQHVTAAADVDFTKSATPGGSWRDAALGVEMQPRRNAWLRGGVHWNTAGGSGGTGAAPIATFGASYAVRGSLMAEAQGSVGSRAGNRGWGIGLRFAF